ncbi:MAG: hypothetical protein QM604_03780, partial [Microbacterium sp.]
MARSAEPCETSAGSQARDHTMTFVDYYELLRVARDADPTTVADAIRAQHRAWERRSRHPRGRTRAVAGQVRAHLAQAEDALLRPARRRAYDSALAA